MRAGIVVDLPRRENNALLYYHVLLILGIEKKGKAGCLLAFLRSGSIIIVVQTPAEQN